MRITDLETFAFEQVMRPFWPTLQTELGRMDPLRDIYNIEWSSNPDTYVGGYRRLVHTLDQVARLLDVGPLEWRMSVFTRLYRMDVRFAPYVQHKLVDVVTVGMGMAHANRTLSDDDA